MKRREFLAASCAAGLVPLTGTVLAKDTDADANAKKEFLELRLYLMASPEKTKALVEFLGAAAIPAWNRIGIQPVGVFEMADGKTPDVYVLLPHKSLESVATANRRVLADAEFLKAGQALLDVPMKDPAYKRIESSLLMAFDACPKVETPTKKDTRVFQLRIYENHSAPKALKKVEMFNTGGEIDIFRRTGLRPVFFGETLVGPKVPNTTYMVAHDDMEASKKSWAAFGADEGWKKLREDPQYKDTVCHITNLFLKPAACSQI